MLKLLGACLILTACTWIGFQMARHVADRPRQIRQLRSALSYLETEIGYGTRPLIQACRQIASQELGPVSRLFATSAKNLAQMDGASTFECFERAIELEWKNNALGRSEQAIMLNLSRTLGISDREDQLHHLALANSNLKVEEMKAREEQERYEKMYKTVGILAGALIVILMY
ncbi:stage III sporulation protein SpoIIIAB [Paenactinomyces guangxiensis]|uniref:Stage III sporulation protein AB n=1 Tax=Paenactinomyces guangxiensis TaxID=1490290 RepID=A0A7W1WS71_9BACL|nr:stage III sporulation protein SpoIIIAB [Paenactinomyces guangxiensis]MBA4494984.1 stage III sporulation protein AB [Paenactinomyces guangxiensis]MBH8592067.1 stage III sporulation protein AB [Paenactinomyces guangxiensis]